MDIYHQLLHKNKEWAAGVLKEDPDFFHKLSNVQKPEVMWIGCSDSRVPASEITGMVPGEIFVHRNITNMVIPTDLNLLSVLQFAVEVLHVKHIIVCGHMNCGGIAAALQHHNYGLMDQWIWHIKDVYQNNREEIEKAGSEEERKEIFTKVNVREQVKNLARTTIVQKAWKAEQYPHLHGWVYDVSDGIIHSVFEMPVSSEIDSIYRIAD